MRVASIGECMIELSALARPAAPAFGGDTLNTAVYLARLGCRSTTSPHSATIPSASDDRGLARRGGRHRPGPAAAGPPARPLHDRRDERGERRFFYWRDSAPARELFDLPQRRPSVEALPATTCSICPASPSRSTARPGASGCSRRWRARARGGRVAFDTNYRPRGWPERTIARAAYRRAFGCADLVLASTEDLEPLFGDGRPAELLARAASAELVLKLPELACRVLARGTDVVVAAEPVRDVVDTTAAGDSFAAAYLAARLAGADLQRRRAPATGSRARWCATPAPSSRGRRCRQPASPVRAPSREGVDDPTHGTRTVRRRARAGPSERRG